MLSFNDFPITLTVECLRYISPGYINRDENSEQKIISINNTDRIFMSSQAIKKCMREEFNFSTYQGFEDLKSKLENYKEEDGEETYYMSGKEINDFFSSLDEEHKRKVKEDEKTVYHVCLKELYRYYKNNKDKKFIDVLNAQEISKEIFLFGRMFAGGDATVEAKIQVSPAFSCTEVEPLINLHSVERSNSNDKGAIHLGEDMDVNGMMYFSANINISELIKEFKRTDNKKCIRTVEDIKETVYRFVDVLCNFTFKTGRRFFITEDPSFVNVTFGQCAATKNARCFYNVEEGKKLNEDDLINKLREYIDKSYNRKMDRFYTRFNKYPELYSMEIDFSKENIKEFKEKLDRVIKNNLN